MRARDSAIRRGLSSPWLYCGWAVFVVAALAAAYPVDPYAFGFASLILAWLTGAVGVVGVAAMALWAWDWTWRRRLLVAAGVAVAAAAVAHALAILSTFNWA